MEKFTDKKNCRQCNKVFYKPQNHTPSRWKKAINCSVRCQRLSYTKKVKMNCDFCEKQYLMHRFRLKDYKRHFCSRSCKGSDKQSSELFKYGLGFKKGFTPWNKNKAWTDDTRQKISDSLKGKMMGEKNPSWKGGLTPLINKLRRLTEYKTWQKQVMVRDNYTCLKCHERGGRLTPHHLKAFSFLVSQLPNKDIQTALNCNELWDVNNGVTLCQECHELTPNYSTKAVKNPIDYNEYSYALI